MNFSLRKIIFILVLFTFLAYLGFEFRGVFFGGSIKITNPKQGQLVDNSNVLVEGRAKYISLLEINGRPIYTDKDGRFAETFIFTPGLNYVVLNAVDKFGRELTEKRMITVRYDGWQSEQPNNND